MAMRNAVEHPSGHSGTLHIHNFRILHEPTKNMPKLSAPYWHLDDDPPAFIYRDQNVFLWNMLEFAEDIVVLCLRKIDTNLPIMIVEIPERERDPECPIRLRFALGETKIKK